MVYLVCAIVVPTDKEKEEGKTEELRGELQAVVANNEQMAGIVYMRKYLPNYDMDQLNKLQVLIRPFA